MREILLNKGKEKLVRYSDMTKSTVDEIRDIKSRLDVLEAAVKRLTENQNAPTNDLKNTDGDVGVDMLRRAVKENSLREIRRIEGLLQNLRSYLAEKLIV